MPDTKDGTRRSPGRAAPGKALIDAGVTILLLGVVAFALYQCARHTTVGLNTLRTQEITDESYASLDLYLFRDERLLRAEGADVFLYDVPDGERIAAGGRVGTAFAAGDRAEALQAELNALRARAALPAAVRGHDRPAALLDAARDAEDAYLSLLRASGQGRLSASFALSDRLLDALGRRAFLTGASPDAGSLSAEIRRERDALLTGVPAVSALQADESGYFYSGTDGYETVFDYASAMTMTAAEFLSLTGRRAEEVPADVAGKTVRSPLWYAAAYVSLGDAPFFPVGRVCSMLCESGASFRIPMTVERMVPDGRGALLVFSSREMPVGFPFPRAFRAETAVSRVSGYRIPAEALVTKKSPLTGEDVTGVYILSGGIVGFRKTDVIARREGYVIARTYEEATAVPEQAAAPPEDGWRYLRLNDVIITGGSALYEGKHLG